MADSTNTTLDHQFVRNAMEASIRIGIVVVLVLWCFSIIKPFLGITLWGMIIAIAVAPGYENLAQRLGNRRGLAALLIVLILMAIIILPAMAFTGTIVDGAKTVAERLGEGDIDVPPPPESVASWPIIGERLANFWLLASGNLEAALDQIQPQIRSLSKWLLGAAATAGFGTLGFLASIIVAGVLLPRSDQAGRTSVKLFEHLVGERGREMHKLTQSTIRSVARGILGVAIIQATLAGIGLFFVGVPAAGLLTMAILMLCVVQLGPGLVMIPVAIWLFSTGDNLTAILFTIYAVPVIVIDNFLKPILLGRGVDVPMLVIFLGAIGGFLSMGIIGLFVGATVLVLGYNLLGAWVAPEVMDEESETAVSGGG
jgi:predicted PurR-regulated permease PerM